MAVNLIHKAMPTVALRGIVIFPGTRFHFDVGRKKSVSAIKAAMNDNQKLFLVAQKDVQVENPESCDLFDTGVIATIRQVIKSPDADYMRVVVEGECRAQISEILQASPYFICDVKERKSTSLKNTDDAYISALLRKVKDAFDEFIHLSTGDFEDALKIFYSDSPDTVADTVASSTIIKYEDRQMLLKELNPVLRLEKLYSLLLKENEILRIEGNIENKVNAQMEKNQREYYLKEKIKTIADELGEGEDILSEVQNYRLKIKELQCNEQIRKKLTAECDKLSKMTGNSADATITRAYLDSALALPFGKYTVDRYDLQLARKTLDRDHYGLKKVKERFIEMLAVKERTEDVKGQIICLVGPPGIGKTSIVRSVAEAMDRKYVRMSLGGVSDEAEIRGHRKTYVGAMPGRIVNALTQAGSFNPIILLDEIDKLGKDYKGDPAAALLEVLDPEQNNTFRDNYIEFPIDLSKALFITTANDASSIPGPLYDRMEVIELTSYTPEEKFMIAKNHLTKKQIKMHGLNGSLLRFSDEGLRYIIENYTKEAGVRRLEQTIGAVCRKCVVKLSDENAKRITVTKALVRSLLGPEKYRNDSILKEDLVGVVNGLAWTSVGGEILQVEAVTMDGDGKLELTGSLGDVMKESAKAALSYIRSLREKYNIDYDLFTKKNIHIHVPQGAVPKDGPSAGVTISTALLSVLTGRKVDRNLAMTGEVTLTGRVLPIGGLKEKSMAAYKAGIKKIIIPQDNYSDLWEIDDVVKDNVEFIPVTSLDEVFRVALKEREDMSTISESSVKFEPHDIIISNRRKKDEIR
ncbi:MAG: endopeptidase La [Clostridia bacterium]|nr:endopeptidase La [Clostridia bacterium]